MCVVLPAPKLGDNLEIGKAETAPHSEFLHSGYNGYTPAVKAKSENIAIVTGL